MPQLEAARDSADAVARFAAILDAAHQTLRIHARWDGADGVAGLCAAEAAIEAVWPRAVGKELIWLTGAASGAPPVLHLEARGADGALVREAAFSVG